MRRKVLLILSGGMDSGTLLYRLKLKEKADVSAITFDYGQRHKKEINYARNLCKELKVKHTVVDIKSLNKLLQGSALTTKEVQVPDGHYNSLRMRKTIVPCRNMIFISIATGYAISMGIKEIALAVHAGDHFIYPDCRPLFINSMRLALNYCHLSRINIYAPYLHKDKAYIAREGLSLGIDYAKTWTCYKGGAKPCGKCGACRERSEALATRNR